MPYRNDDKNERCDLCGSAANRFYSLEGFARTNCERCGDFIVEEAAIDHFRPTMPSTMIALASHQIRMMQGANPPRIGSQFFLDLRNREPLTPAEQVDNVLLHLAQKAEGRPGAMPQMDYRTPEIQATIGVVNMTDLQWVGSVLASQQLFSPNSNSDINSLAGQLTWDLYPI
jgi:hypothetical protein